MAKPKKTEPIIEDEVVETTISVKWDGNTSRAYRSAQPETVVEPEVTSEPAEDGGQEEA